MKKVIFEKTPDVVNINNITDNSHVGIKFRASSYKVWVIGIKSSFYGCVIGKSNLNSTWHESSKKDYCIKADRQEADIFVFDTQEELVNWLQS